ncbi:MAG: translation initiation factor IF-2 [Myxococcota bacterium]
MPASQEPAPRVRDEGVDAGLSPSAQLEVTRTRVLWVDAGIAPAADTVARPSDALQTPRGSGGSGGANAVVARGSGGARGASASRKQHSRATGLRIWSQPGLCATSSESTAVRQTLLERFRSIDAGKQGRFYIDPRLPEDAQLGVARELDRAELVMSGHLKITPPRPDTFVYFDAELLQSSACVNRAVAAYYDGALHVVANDPDLPASVLHEYAHHALMSMGMRGPAWAQEGLAMHLAGERWWLAPSRLQRVARSPFSLDDMDQSIPYKLKEEEAVSFYVQAALMVACLLDRMQSDLASMARALRSPATSSEAADWLAAASDVAQPASLRDCMRELNGAAPLMK